MSPCPYLQIPYKLLTAHFLRGVCKHYESHSAKDCLSHKVRLIVLIRWQLLSP